MASENDPILPTLGSVIGAAKDKLAEVRPTTIPHLEEGEYANVIAGWRGQFAKAKAYLAAEVKAARLPFSEKQALTELVRSEFDVERNADPTKATGEVVLTRTVVHYTAGFAIDAADATDQDSIEDLLEAIAARANEHLASVYSSSVGGGLHVTADGSVTFSVALTNMGTLCNAANNFKTYLNRHFLNQIASSGLAGTFHKDADPNSLITSPSVTPANGALAFSACPLSEQTALLTQVNEIKAVFNEHAALEAKPGTIRKGTVFRVAASPTSVPPIAGGQYVVTQDCYAATGVQSVSPKVEATVDGPSQNLPIFSVGGPTLTITSAVPLFDTGATLPLAITTLRAAGGSSGQSDPELRRAATAAWGGTYGPTVGALDAGALRSKGVSHLRILEDTTLGKNVVYAADPSWAWSDAWSARIERELRDTWLGTGCRVGSAQVSNRIVRVEATVALRDADSLVDPSDITDALRAACLAYFDDRVDWYIWRLSALKAVLSRASRQILRCSSVLVKDEDGLTISEPTAPSPGSEMTHWYFADNALDVSYTGPT